MHTRNLFLAVLVATILPALSNAGVLILAPATLSSTSITATAAIDYTPTDTATLTFYLCATNGKAVSASYSTNLIHTGSITSGASYNETFYGLTAGAQYWLNASVTTNGTTVWGAPVSIVTLATASVASATDVPTSVRAYTSGGTLTTHANLFSSNSGSLDTVVGTTLGYGKTVDIQAAAAAAVAAQATANTKQNTNAALNKLLILDGSSLTNLATVGVTTNLPIIGTLGATNNLFLITNGVIKAVQ